MAGSLPTVKVRSRVSPAAKVSPAMATFQPKAVERQAVSKRIMVEALKASKGNVAHACKLAGISRMTHYRWTREDANYAAVFDEIGEEVVDNVETLFLKTMISEKDLRSMRWYLERKGKERGYGKPSVQQFDADGNPINTIGVQNNNILVLREDVPNTSISLALADILRNRPELLEQAKLAPPREQPIIDVELDDDTREEVEDSDDDYD
jgi:hypothetical protein